MSHKFLLSLITVGVMALPASAQTVDDVIGKHIQARGGLEKLKAVKTIRYTGKMTVGPGMEVPAIMEQKRPNNIRLEFTLQGLTAVVAYDGKTGWQTMPFGGKKDPEPLPEEAVKEFSQQADFDGPLVDYKEKGNQVEFVGKESVEGTDAYKLKVTLKSGDIRYIYLDTDSYLDIKQEGKRTVRGTEIEFESAIGDYKEVDGLMIPHSIENGARGNPQKQKIAFEKVEINPPIDDARFRMPEVKKPETAPEEKKPPPAEN